MFYFRKVWLSDLLFIFESACLKIGSQIEIIMNQQLIRLKVRKDLQQFRKEPAQASRST